MEEYWYIRIRRLVLINLLIYFTTNYFIQALYSIKVDTNIWFLQNQVIPNVIGLYTRPILI